MLVVTRILLQFFLQHVGRDAAAGAAAGVGAAVSDSAVSAAAAGGDGGICVHAYANRARHWADWRWLRALRAAER